MLGLIGGNALHSDAKLRDRIAVLQAGVDGTAAKNADIEGQIDELQKASDELQTENDQLTAELQATSAELKARDLLPNLMSKPRKDAQLIADQYGWQITVKEKESAERMGTILSQSPKAGTLMSLGRGFTVVVAKPFPPKMPNLVGDKLKDAEALAEKYGWIFDVSKEVSAEPAGTIIRQTPAPGTYMRGAATFTIVIAKKAPAPCDANYTGACLDPNAIDYDCARGTGDGPLYVYGPVYVVGYDHYGLDGNNNGIGCE